MYIYTFVHEPNSGHKEHGLPGVFHNSLPTPCSKVPRAEE